MRKLISALMLAAVAITWGCDKKDAAEEAGETTEATAPGRTEDENTILALGAMLGRSLNEGDGGSQQRAAAVLGAVGSAKGIAPLRQRAEERLWCHLSRYVYPALVALSAVTRRRRGTPGRSARRTDTAPQRVSLRVRDARRGSARDDGRGR